MYYTTRELSNRAAELDVLRSLGQEVIVDGDTSRSGGIPTIPGGAGGVSWLQEHLRTNYTPGWTTLVRDNKTDAAVGDVGVSRWGNYTSRACGTLPARQTLTVCLAQSFADYDFSYYRTHLAS